MKYLRKNSEHKQSCNVRSLVIALFWSILIIQVSIACGANPQARLPTALAASHTMNCVNPLPPNNGATAPPAPGTPGIVVINEVLLSSQLQWNCTGAGGNAWIEIYNPQNQPYDLYAIHASIDEGPGTDPYMFPFGSIISPYGFFVVFPFGNLYPNSFAQLPPIRLVFNSQVVIDQVSTPDLLPDTSYARIPDGSPNWQITTTPTIGSSNQYPTGTVQATSNTSTPTHTAKRQTTTTHNSGTSNDKSTSDAPNTGVQPTWSTLRLPSSEQHYFTAQQGNSSSLPVSSASTTPADHPFDLLKKILLTLFIITTIPALLWGWQLLHLAKRRKPGKNIVTHLANSNSGKGEISGE